GPAGDPAGAAGRRLELGPTVSELRFGTTCCVGGDGRTPGMTDEVAGGRTSPATLRLRYPKWFGALVPLFRLERLLAWRVAQSPVPNRQVLAGGRSAPGANSSSRWSCRPATRPRTPRP